MKHSETKREEHPDLLQIVNNTVLKIAILILMSSMVIILSLNVFFRYILNFSLTFSAELAGYLMVWIAFLGTVVIYYNNDHIAVNLIEKKFNKNALRILHIFQHIACAAFFFILIFYGFKFFNMTTNQACTSMDYPPLNYIYIIIPISGIFLLLGAIYKLYYIIFGRKGRL